MSKEKDRDLMFDLGEEPDVLTYPAADNEPLQLGGVDEDAASAAANRQVTTPGNVHVAPQMPTPIDGTLRQFALRVPSVIDECSGIMVFGKRIKSLVFSTDLCIIRNVNADAVFAVYPFTPQPIITQALLMASDLPVFVGVGGGLTTGKRVVNLAMYAEMQGATGVVVNAPTPGRILNRIRNSVDVPVVVTVADSDTNYRHRADAGDRGRDPRALSRLSDPCDRRNGRGEHPCHHPRRCQRHHLDAPVQRRAVPRCYEKLPRGQAASLICRIFFLFLLLLDLFSSRERHASVLDACLLSGRVQIRLRTTHACSRVVAARGWKPPSGMPPMTPARCSACTAGRA